MDLGRVTMMTSRQPTARVPSRYAPLRMPIPWLLALMLVCGVCPPSARADDEPQPYARVIVEHATVRAGPGIGFRGVYQAQRGEVFPLRSRASAGYWFQIELPDATLGWVAGDLVYNHEVGEDEASGGRFLPWLLAPPPLPGARGEIAISAGLLGEGGMLSVRPTVLLDPAFGFELSAGAAVATGGRLLLTTVGPIVNVFPSSPVVPFATLQGGVTLSSPNADTFLLDSGGLATLSAGVGLRIGFRFRLTLRLEAREHVFFEADRRVAEKELSAGLTVFF
jgi:hypothetical protein